MAGGGSAAREWEFSSPGYGDCSITRVGAGAERVRVGERVSPGRVGGVVSEHFRSVGGAVSALVPGCWGCGPGAVRSHAQLRNGSRLAALCLRRPS